MKFLVIQGSPVDRPEFVEYTNAKAIQRSLIHLNHECELWGIDYPNFNEELDYEKYDVILLIENYGTGWYPDLSKTKKPYKMLWAIDTHQIGMAPFLAEFNRSKYHKICQASRAFLRDGDLWFPCSFDNTNILPMKEVAKEYEFGFCGTPLNRAPFFKQIEQRGIPLKMDVGQFGLNNVRAINSYKVHINKNLSVDINIRNFETIGCKTMLMTNYSPDYEILGFKEGVNYMSYQSLDELVDKCKFCMDNPGTVNIIAERGYELSKKHSFHQRMKHLLKFLETI